LIIKSAALAIKDALTNDFLSMLGGARKKTTHTGPEAASQQDGRSTGAASNSDPNIVQDQYKWTIHNASVNLPALLNDPRLARRETDFFTKTWGQNFEKADVIPSPYIPDVEAEHFEKYMKRVAVVSLVFFVVKWLLVCECV
jgi:vacuolar protein sorting-associated protein 54